MNQLWAEAARLRSWRAAASPLKNRGAPRSTFLEIIFRDRCSFITVVLIFHVLPRKVRQLAADLKARNFNAQHCSRMCPRKGEVLVSADQSPLWGPDDVNDPR